VVKVHAEFDGDGETMAVETRLHLVHTLVKHALF